MKKSFAVALLLAFTGAIGMSAVLNAQQQTGVSQNQNVITGSDDQFIGDMFRQRQNEGVVGTSSVNPLHQMVAYNDYRTVDMAEDADAVVPPSPMGVLHKLWNLLRAPLQLARGERERDRGREAGESGEEGEMGDSAQAWIGLSFTDNGKDWYTGLHPGHPFDNSNLAPVLKNGPDGRGYEAASDPVMATTADKFFVGGIAFTPGPNGNSVGFVSRFVDRNDTETGRNIQYEWTKPLIVAPTGFFVDKPNIAAGPDGHVYVAYVVFDQNDPQRLSSKIYFYRSTNYGETWSTTPVILSDPLTRNQSPWILVDPNDETTVYVGWRVFSSRSGGIANAIVGRRSTNAGASFAPSTPYVVASQLKAFDQPQGKLPESLPIPRSNAYPTATIDGNGALHVAIQEYVNANGSPLGGGTPITNGIPRITVTSSYDRGVSWTARRAVDFAAGSGTQFMPVLTAVGEPGASCPGSSGPRSRIMLSYYDARAGNVGTKPGTNGFVIGGDKQFDVRITTAPACPLSSNRLVFSPSVQMSRYSLSADKPHGIQKTAGFDQFTAVNRAYSMFCGGNCAFTGDYMHLAPRVPYVLTAAGWRPTTSNAVDKTKLPAPVVQGVWADARDVKLPITPAAPVPVTHPTFIDSLPWWNYQAPGSGKLPSMCENAGSRDQNIYTAEFAPGELFAAAPETFRTSNIPRAYPLYLENRAGTQRLFRLRIDPAALASFDFKSFNTVPPNFNVGGRNNRISDVVIGAYSSVTGSVIVGAGVSAPVQITVEQIDGNGRAITGGARTSVTLFTAGLALESDTETHPPLVSQTPTITKPFAGKTPISFQQSPFTQTPFTQTPFTQTPFTQTPFTQTPFTQNPFSQTPFTQTPFTQTTTIFDVTDISFLVSNGGANTAAFSTLLTLANAQLLEGLRTSNSYLFQVFINRLTPVALLNGCQSVDGLENVQVSNILAPFTQTPFTQTPFTQTPFTQTPFTQTPFTQTPFTQTPFTQTNNPSDPTVSNSTFYVAPPSPGDQTARLKTADAPRAVNASLTFAELEAMLRGAAATQAPTTDDFRNQRPSDLIMYSLRAYQIKASNDPTFVSLFAPDGTPQVGITVKSDAPNVIQVNGQAVFDPAGPQTSSGGAAVPVRLAFLAQPPASNLAGSPFSVQVAVQDGFGNRIANSSVPVTIALGSNPGGGALSGVLTRNAVNGIATFDSLSINNAGQGYTLVATSGLLAPATTSLFNVISAFVVTNTSDSGAGSLRQALVNANAAPLDQMPIIRFAIPGTGVQTIQPTSALPTVERTMEIDGTSQPGWTETSPQPRIELDGTNAPPGTNGLHVTGSFVTIRGLAINRFKAEGIRFDKPATGGVVEHNFIGTNAAGTAALGNLNSGVYIRRANNISLLKNVISGNLGFAGVAVCGNPDFCGGGTDIGEPGEGSGLELTSNWIGTNAAGTAAIPNQGYGVSIDSASGATIGINNVIAGNANHGVVIFGVDANDNVIRSSRIGMGVGVNSIPNGGYGIAVLSGTGNVIGGPSAVNGNVIGFETAGGVLVAGATATNNPILNNSIFRAGPPCIEGCGTALGIDLSASSSGGDGVTANDPGDNDSGGNNLQNFPVITATTATVAGSLSSTAGNYRIQLFSNTECNANGFGDGQTLIASFDGETDDGGAMRFIVPELSLTLGTYVTATATRMGDNSTLGNTSEFSRCAIVGEIGAPAALAFTTPPSPTGGRLAPFQVVVQDGGGDAASSSAPITISFGSNPGKARLSGTLTRNAIDGVATFDDLSVSNAAQGYTLVASSEGLVGTESAPFNIVGTPVDVVLPGDPEWVSFTPAGTAAEVSSTQPRSGLGSLEFVTGINRTARFSYTPRAPLGTYGQLSAFSYDWYIDPESEASLPALVTLRVYDATDPRTFLIGWDSCEPVCRPQPTGVWQTTTSFGNLSLFHGEFGARPGSLAEIPPDAPITGIVIDGNFALGGPWFGYVDNVTVGFVGASPRVFNFEVDSPAQRRVRPEITWENPSSVNGNITLGASQLNATANVAGAFTYLPPAGTMLVPEFHILATSLAPSDAAQYLPTAKIVPLIVTGTSVVLPDSGWWFPYLPEPTSFAAVTNTNKRSGIGSLELRKVLGFGSAFIREQTRVPLGRLNELSALSYDWFIDPVNTTLRPPEIALRVYEFGDPRSFFLFWNACPPGQPCPTYQAGSWQTTDVLEMLSIQSADGNPPPASLAEVPADAPITGIHVRANHANGQAWHGFADNVTIAFGDQPPIVYNFEAGVGFESVSMQSPTAVIDGAAVPYQAFLKNHNAPLVAVSVEASIIQGAAVRAAGGAAVSCDGTPFSGNLPTGACVFSGQFTASNASAGSGILVAGPALARFELRQGNTATVLDTFTVPIELTATATADRLAVLTQPTTTFAGATLAPVRIAIQDAGSITLANANDAVTIAIAANPGNGTLFGTLTRNAVNGIATFDDLSIDLAANGYTLVASSGTLTTATSEPFNILPSVFVVTTTADSGPGSLRQAILDANARPVSTSTIRFNLAGTAPHTFTPASPLPLINASTIVDGTPGGVCTSAAPTVVIDGRSAGAGAHGLVVNSPGVTIRGLAVTRFTQSGIFLAGGGNNRVECNYIGLLPDGTAAANQDGVLISGSSSNQIVGNAISGNSRYGVHVTNGNANEIRANFIGMTLDGTLAVPNATGVFLSGEGTTATQIVSNMISGNNGWGVDVENSRGLVTSTSIRSNIIGLDFLGLDAGNAGGGVRLNQAPGTIVGGPGGRNVISGNGGVGPAIGVGIQVLGNVEPPPTIQSNYIGLDLTGVAARSNNNKGIVLDGAARIGGDQPLEGNYISGNGDAAGGAGIIANLAAEGSIIYGNVIGLNVNGDAVGNGYSGITIRTPGNVTVGSVVPNSGNVISGNGSYGISIIKIVAGDPDPASAVISRNWIGSDADGTLARGNGLAGIRIEGARHLVGGVGAGNVIAHNGLEGGIRVVGPASTTVQIRENVIRDNGGLGIDLGGDGPTANDPGDADIGPNTLLNHPVIVSATNNGGTTTVTIDTSSLGSGDFPVEIFSSPTCNAGGLAQAAQFRLPRDVGVSGGSGLAEIVLDDLIPAGHYITAATLTTSADGWFVTSELSPCMQVDPFVALTPDPLAIVTKTSAPMTVTLSHPAGPGGKTVNLASNNPVVGVDPSIVIAEGASKGTATITTGSVTGSAIITAAAGGLLEGTATVNVSLRTIILSAPSTLVGVGRSLTGTITLAQPAPTGGMVVTLVSGNTNFVTVSPSSVAIPQGATTASFTINGIASGSATITALANAASDATLAITATTSSLISMGNPPAVAPGQTSGVAVSLGIDAPAGGVTIAFTSSDSNVATVTPSVFIPAGLRIPAANPQITGITPGTASITASAAGFAPDTKAANVTLTLTFTPATNFAVIAGRTSTITLNLSSPAPAGGLTLNTSIDNTALATVPATVFAGAGLTSVAVPVTGVAVGTTTIRASGTGIAQASASVRVDPTPPINISTLTIGKDLQAQLSGLLGLAAPPGGVVVTIRSLDPTKLLLATTINAVGSASITRTVNAGSTSISTFWVQALEGAGTADIEATATGYATDTSTMTLQPSGFIFNSGNIATNTRAANTLVQVAAARLNPLNGRWAQNQQLRGGLTVQVPVASSNTAAGTIVGSPARFGGGDVSADLAFDPVGDGISTLSLTPPAGFTTATDFQTLTATVAVPAIRINDVTIGKDLQVSTSGTLDAPAPAGGIDVRITSADPARLLLSTTSTGIGSGSITLRVNAGVSGIPAFWVQALDGAGTVQFTASAPGYSDDSAIAALNPSGFIVNAGNLTTNTFAANTTITISSSRLNPANLRWTQTQPLRGGVSVDVIVSSSNTAVGAIIGSPVSFVGGDANQTVAFDPLSSGISTISVTTPAGFATPLDFQSITATVTAPAINISDVTVGRDLQTAMTITLGAVPPTPVNVTISINDAGIATISRDGTVAGSASVTFANVSTSLVGTVFVQGRGIGKTTLTASAPNYDNGTGDITVDPSGFIVNANNITTNTFAGNTTIQISASRLNPLTGRWAQTQELRGGLTVSVPVVSSDTNVGTILGSPAAFAGRDANVPVSFRPATAGTTTISVNTPTGFTTPTDFQSVVATVSAPAINVGDATVGRDLQTPLTITLGAIPPSAVTVTVTSNNGSIATVTRDGQVAGGTSVTFTNVTTQFVGSFLVQGRGVGTTTLTIQAAGYNDADSNVTVDPSGFILNTGDITTNTFAANTPLRVDAARLNPSTLNFAQSQQLRGGVAVDVVVSSSNPSVGTIVGSPAAFAAGDLANQLTSFNPAAAGTTTISIAAPAGFSRPSNFQSITASVSAPDILIGDATVGRDLQVGLTVFLESAPPGPVTVTVTSTSGAIATVARDGTIAGGTTATFTNVTTTNVGTIFVQGRSLGETTVTVQAAGYDTATSDVTVDPSGFILNMSDFTTTANAANTFLRVDAARLNPQTLNLAQSQELRGGLTVSVPVSSSNTAAGTIEGSPAIFNGRDLLNQLTLFNPAAVGSSTISIGTPAGFSTPSNFQSVRATVNP